MSALQTQVSGPLLTLSHSDRTYPAQLRMQPAGLTCRSSPVLASHHQVHSYLSRIWALQTLTPQTWDFSHEFSEASDALSSAHHTQSGC